jgi:hypothetical protein
VSFDKNFLIFKEGNRLLKFLHYYCTGLGMGPFPNVPQPKPPSNLNPPVSPRAAVFFLSP